MNRTDQRDNGEHREQCALFVFLDRFAHIHPKFRVIHAIPNGGARDARTGAALKRSGVRRGTWDICVPFPRVVEGMIAGSLYIEMKHGSNKLTIEQIAFRDALITQNMFVVAYSWIEAARAIVDYLDIIDPRIAAFLTDNARVTLPKERKTAGTPAK